MKFDISAIGNALVDTQFMVENTFLDSVNLAPDQMMLVTYEEQKEILNKLESLNLESTIDCGGSATNSLVAASYYGSKCNHICKINNDEDGKRYFQSLEAAGVNHAGMSTNNIDKQTGKCLILVNPQAQRTMCSALGISEYLDMHDFDMTDAINSKIFFIEGYMVTSESNFNTVIHVLESLKDTQTQTFLSLSDQSIVNIFRDRFSSIMSYNIDFVFGNHDEAMTFTQTSSLEGAVEAMKNQNFISIITCGAEGSILINGEDVIRSSAQQIKPVDTNGAGDMFAGSFMHAFLNDYNFGDCLAFANLAASKIVETFGPRLQQHEYKDLASQLKNIKNS